MCDFWMSTAIFFYYVVKYYLIIAGFMYVFTAFCNIKNLFSSDRDDRLIVLMVFSLGLVMISLGVFVFNT